MSNGQIHEQQIVSMINKCRNKNITLDKNIDFSSIHPNQLKQVLKIYSQNLINFGPITAETFLEQALITISIKLNTKQFSQGFQNIEETNQNRSAILNQEKHQKNQIIVVIKDREKQNDLKISDQWKLSRHIFFTNSIEEMLKSIKASQRQLSGIFQLFLNSNYQQNIDFNNLGALGSYRNEIERLHQQFQRLHIYYSNKQKQCLPILSIIQNKITFLRVIHIQYHRNREDLCLYSICAFQLFSVLNENQSLIRVTLKGVQVKRFENFTKQLNLIKNKSQIEESENDGLYWIKHFNPNRSLQLTIEAELVLNTYNIKNKDKVLSMINNLAYFCQFFQWVSESKSISIQESGASYKSGNRSYMIVG